MKTSTTTTTLLFSALAVCLPVASAFGQASAVAPEQSTPSIGYPGRTHIHVNPALLEAERKAWEAIGQGEAALKTGSPYDAISAFQDALSYEPDNGLAYQRLAEAQTVAGKLNDAAASYRTVLYKWPGKNWSGSENGDPIIHMQFAQLLQRLNQRAEALTVYQHGYQLLQLEDAPTTTTPAHGPFPPMLTSPDFTPAQLEAAAVTVTAIHKFDWLGQNTALADFQHVVSLQPNSALAYYYMGQIYSGQPGHRAESDKALRKAAQLGGAEMQPFLGKAQR